MTTVWMFPGQGAQRRGMGAELFDRFPAEVELADEVLGYSTRELCLADPSGQLQLTQFVQPVLFLVNALTWMAHRQEHPEPGYLVGHSLGEFNALLAAGVFDLETGVRLVRRRGELMSRATGGSMLAVVGPEVGRRIPELLATARIDDVDVANLNSAEQLVLAGPVDALEAVSALVIRAGAGRCRALKVSAAFHSRYMAAAAGDFAGFLAGVPLGPPRLPVIANVTAQPYQPGQVGETLVRQIGSSVRWADSMAYLVAHGVHDAVELGPGTVLSRLWAAAVAAGAVSPIDPPGAAVPAEAGGAGLAS